MAMAKKVDPNQAEIVEALRKAGAHVYDTHELGRGFPDLAVSFMAQWHLVEVKMPGGALTVPQLHFIVDAKAPIVILETSEQAVRWLNSLR